MIRSAAIYALLTLSAGCDRRELPPLPEAVEATGVRATGAGWDASAAGVSLVAGQARAADVTATVGASSPASASAPGAGGGPPPPATPSPERAAGSALTIRAAASEWDLKARVARFEGPVEVTRGPVTLRTPSLTVTYAGPDRVERVEATGGVEVTRGERRARADHAVLDAATGEISLTGAPRLAEGPNVLEGTRIVLYLDHDRARCEGAEGAPCRLVVDGAALR